LKLREIEFYPVDRFIFATPLLAGSLLNLFGSSRPSRPFASYGRASHSQPFHNHPCTEGRSKKNCQAIFQRSEEPMLKGLHKQAAAIVR
jgi:hypothetical protein